MSTVVSLRGEAEAIQNLKAPRCARAQLYMDRHGRKLPRDDGFRRGFKLRNKACTAKNDYNKGL